MAMVAMGLAKLIEECGEPRDIRSAAEDRYLRRVLQQAKEANRLRAGLETLQRDVEAMGLGLLYLRISELLEGEE